MLELVTGIVMFWQVGPRFVKRGEPVAKSKWKTEKPRTIAWRRDIFM